MRRRRIILTALALTGGLVAIAIVRPMLRIRSYDAALATLNHETSEADVLARMGASDRVEMKVFDAFWDDRGLGDDVARRVVKQYWYTVSVPPVPISWTVGFDAGGHVISKHRWD